MSAYYDLFEKPDVRQTGEQQSLYARFVPKGTIDRKEFIERVHLFTGLSRSLSCATALPMAGRWSWANWVTSPPL